MIAKRALTALLLAAVLPAASLPLAAQEIQINKDNRTVAVTTTGEASAPADTAAVTIGFQSFGRDRDATYRDASGTSNAIAAALAANHVPKEGIESTSQGLSPLPPDSNEDKERYAEGLRFQFLQSWRVTVPAAQAAGVLGAAIAAGANQSGNIEWSLKGEDALEAEAARNALKRAREVAGTMAEGLGAKLGSLLYASNQAPSRIPFTGFAAGANPLNGRAMPMSAIKVAPLAIHPERITKSTTVYAVFALQ